MLTSLPFPFTEECDDKQPLTSKEEEERRIAEMGRPILGEHTKLEVIIEESYEFKVCSPTLPTREARAVLGLKLFVVSDPSGKRGRRNLRKLLMNGQGFRAESELES